MTIASEIQRIQTNIANAYDALEEKGATMPATENTDNLVATIDTISGGGGDVVTATNNTGSTITASDKVWINENNGNYSIEKLKELRNFNVIGNPTINDSTHIVSGFSTSNYLQLQTAFNPGNNPWEILFKVRTGSDVSTNQKIIHFSKGSDFNGRYGIGLNFINSKFGFFCSSDGNSWLFDLSGTYTPLSNTLYWVKVSFNGSAYKLQYSLDGENFVDDIIYNSSSTVYTSLPYCRIGVYQSTTLQDPFLGSIDLSETYINVNGNLWWKPYLLGVTENSLTGYAQENISSGSTGEVLTLLPPEPASKTKRLVSVANNLDTNKLVLYTDDGINWNTSTMPNSRIWANPFYGDGKFIVADYRSGIFAYSSDGINWTEGTAFSTQYNTYTVLKGAYGNGVYLLACNTGNTGTGYLFKSTDGINWTDGYNFYDVSNPPGRMIDFIFDGNRFIAFFNSSVCQYSTDGVSWTKAGRPFDIPYNIPNNYRATTIYDSVNSRYIHGVGFYLNGTTATNEQHIYTSQDLTNWTEIYTHNYNNFAPVTSCIFDGETKIFSGWSSLSQQSAGYINIDSTGTATFVGSSVPRLNYVGGANVINDRAVVIGYGSDQYIYSTDGTTWNTGTLPASSGWWGSCVGEVD